MGDSKGQMQPVQRFSFRNSSSCSCSLGERGYTLHEDSFSPGSSSMAWSQVLHSGSESKDSLTNTSSKSWRYGGMNSLSLVGVLQRALSASCYDVFCCKIFGFYLVWKYSILFCICWGTGCMCVYVGGALCVRPCGMWLSTGIDVHLRWASKVYMMVSVSIPGRCMCIDSVRF